MALATLPRAPSPSPASLPPRLFRPIAPSPASSQLLPPLHRPVATASFVSSPSKERAAPAHDAECAAARQLSARRSPPPAAVRGPSAPRRFSSFSAMRECTGMRRGGGEVAEDEPALLLGGGGGFGVGHGDSAAASLRRHQTALPPSSAATSFYDDGHLARHGSVRVSSSKKFGLRLAGGGGAEPTRNELHATLTPLSGPLHVRATRKLRTLFRRRRRSSPPQDPPTSGESVVPDRALSRRDSLDEHCMMRPVSSDGQLTSERALVCPRKSTPDRPAGKAPEQTVGLMRSAPSFDSESGISDVTWESSPDATAAASTWAESAASARPPSHAAESAPGVVRVDFSAKADSSIRRKVSFAGVELIP